MGAVLAMICEALSRTQKMAYFSVLASCIGLFGCGHMGMSGGKEGDATLADHTGKRMIARIPARNHAAFLYEIEAVGGVRAWQSLDNMHIYTRDGILVGTRGFGADLMTRDFGTGAKVLRSGEAGTYSRIDRILDGQDRLEIRAYICEVSPHQEDRIQVDENLWRNAMRVDQTCYGPNGPVNEYFWIHAGQVIQSISSISDGPGPIDILFMP